MRGYLSHTDGGWIDVAALARVERERKVLRRFAGYMVKRCSSSLFNNFVLLALFVVVLRTTLVESFFVPSSSMTPTIQEEDYILVPKIMYGLRLPVLKEMLIRWSTPKRGDVIVFTRRDGDPSAKADEAQSMVKRVIALEGDLVEIFGDQVYLNGEALVEPYALWTGVGETQSHFGPYRVPSGKVFVLGDNRSNSFDSRAWPDPFVSITDVVGKAVMVYWSGSVENRMGMLL